MGIRGRVYCRCYADGDTPKPPVPVRTTDLGEVVPDSDEPGAQFDEWARDACPHEGWLAAACEVSWLDVQRLLELINDHGHAQFRTLLAHVPAWPGQWVTRPDAASELVAELDRLETVVGGVAVDQLFVDGELAGIWTRRGEPLWLWRRAPELVGLSGRGSVAVWGADDVTAAPVFEAARIRQRPATDGFGFDLAHGETGDRHRVAPALVLHGKRPDTMEVRWTQLTPAEYCPAIPALRQLWQAAASLNQPAIFG